MGHIKVSESCAYGTYQGFDEHIKVSRNCAYGTYQSGAKHSLKFLTSGTPPAENLDFSTSVDFLTL